MPPDDASAETAAPPPRARRAAFALVVAVAIGLVGVGLTRNRVDPPRPSTAPVSTPEPSGPVADRGYLVSLEELRTRVARAAGASEPEAAAFKDLVAWARTAVDVPAQPAEPLRIDGTTGPFVDDSARAYGLALAWGATGEIRYADAARRITLAWVSTTRTLANACPNGGDCHTSLIVSRAAPGFVFAIDLLGPSGVVSAADRAAFDGWLRSVILPAASERQNNWGDAGVLLRVVATDALADSAGFAAAIDAWRVQLDLIAADGHIPEEVRRGSAGLSYTQEALMYKLAVARIAERRGIDLWSAVGSGGGTLRAAVDLDARYQQDPTAWPFDGHVDRPHPSPAWELAYAHWLDPDYAAILGPLRPYGADGHSAVRWTTLTNGVGPGG